MTFFILKAKEKVMQSDESQGKKFEILKLCNYWDDGENSTIITQKPVFLKLFDWKSNSLTNKILLKFINTYNEFYIWLNVEEM